MHAGGLNSILTSRRVCDLFPSGRSCSAGRFSGTVVVRTMSPGSEPRRVRKRDRPSGRNCDRAICPYRCGPGRTNWPLDQQNPSSAGIHRTPLWYSHVGDRKDDYHPLRPGFPARLKRPSRISLFTLTWAVLNPATFNHCNASPNEATASPVSHVTRTRKTPSAP
jgi:hypothetical protein